MIIDCQTCPVRGRECGDCIVPILLDSGPGLPLDDNEARAVEVFLGAGLIAEAEALTLRARTEPWARARAVG